jgi:hypothetical protein
MTNWAAVVGFSGTSKTPGIDATRRGLSHIERDRRSKIDDLRCAHEGRVEAAKAARALWKKEVESAAKGKVVSLDEYRNTVTSEPVMPAAATDPGPFVAPRLYVSNVTIERLAVLLQARPGTWAREEISAAKSAVRVKTEFSSRATSEYRRSRNFARLPTWRSSSLKVSGKPGRVGRAHRLRRDGVIFQDGMKQLGISERGEQRVRVRHVTHGIQIEVLHPMVSQQLV